MRLKSVSIKEFRRFSDLKVLDLPESAKLIILCGPNGTGKSSLFDALIAFQSATASFPSFKHDPNFYTKIGFQSNNNFMQKIDIQFHGSVTRGTEEMKKVFYVRTAYRNDPDFVTGALNKVGTALDEARPSRTIDPDVRVASNYSRLVSITLENLYNVDEADGISAFDLRERIIGEIRDTLVRIYPNLILTSLGSPLDTGSFYFSKGAAKNFIYKNLSAGEKAVFDLILDLVIKRQYYDDTIWCIDEPEAHLNTRVQGPVLRELVGLIPEGSQMILATHSIGFMREAHTLSREQPGLVTFIDFQNANFDEAVELRPVEVSREFWRRTLNVALGDLADLVSPEVVVLCEGKPLKGKVSKNTEFDAKCYRVIFGRELPNVEFVSVGNAHDVTANKVDLGQSIQFLTPGSTILRVTDRDLMNQDEVAELETTGVRVISRRHIESYLLDDEVISKFCENEGATDQAAAVIQERDRLIAVAVKDRGVDPDDLKSIAGELLVYIRRSLGLAGLGSTWPAFAVSSLAPSIQPGMAVYAELKQAIFRS